MRLAGWLDNEDCGGWKPPLLFFGSLFQGFPIHFRVEHEHWLAGTHASGTQISGRSLALMSLGCKVRKQNDNLFWSLPDRSDARCANATDSKNGALDRVGISGRLCQICWGENPAGNWWWIGKTAWFLEGAQTF